jgi:DNA-binding transcriptional regulator YhcF (GntR family)
MAEYEPRTEIKRYQELRIERGEVLLTIRELADRWKWSRTKVVNFINALEGQKMVTQKVTSVGTVLTIENYNIYQDGDTEEKTEKKTAERQPKDSRKLSTSYKEYKETKEDKNIARTRARDIPHMHVWQMSGK